MRKLIASAVSAVMTASLFASFAASVSALDNYSLGDWNTDGFVDASDASGMLGYYAAVSTGGTAAAPNLSYTDMNGDKKVDASDASCVLEYYSYASTGGEMSSNAYMDVKNLESKGINIYLNPDAYLGKDCVRVKINNASEDEQYKKQFSEDFSVVGYDVRVNKTTVSTNTTELVGEQYVTETLEGGRYYPSYSGTTLEHCKIVSAPMPALEDSDDVTYTVYVVPHCIIKGVEVKGTANSCGIDKIQFIINNAELKPHDTYPLYNIKVSPPVHKTNYTVSAKDKEILAEFAKHHFTEDMGNYEKLEITWIYLNMNMTYAKGDLYKDIISDSWVSACFVKKKAQCLQYNGALAELMAQMGYDVYMLEMWLGENNTNQHFRAEVNIGGQAYSMEVGNNGDYPGWMWLFKPVESSIKGLK